MVQTGAPLISIIVVTKNAGNTLRGCFESIIRQSEPSYEVIVVDGASTDETLPIVRDFSDHITTCISEPDRGIFDAMNKGVTAVSGSWVLFLGADDQLSQPTTLQKVREKLREVTGGIVCGEARYSDGRIWRPPHNPRPLLRNFLHHQATFYHRSILHELPYDHTLRYQGDYDLNLKLWSRGISIHPIDLRISECASGGASDAGRWGNYREEILVRHRYASGIQTLLWDAGTVLRFVRKKLLRTFISNRPEKRSAPSRVEKSRPAK